jgi:hypothetical protein
MMSPRAKGRVQTCSQEEAKTRLSHARKFLEVAGLTATEENVEGAASVSASLAVLAGIAASDAACCSALGQRARGQDHREAIRLLEQVEPKGDDAAKSLRRLLDLKDTAQYGLIHVSQQNLKAALRQAGTLLGFAEGILRR